jgi:hypothetical protein
MSGLGHLAAAFVAKPAAPKVPLWVFLVAAEANDGLYFVFSALGLEPKVATTMSFTEGVRYLAPSANPWSHGLFMATVWASLAAALAFLVYRDRRASLLLGLVVLSHWALDLLMHANLPLFFDGSPLVGLGLENSGPGLIFMTVFDLSLLTASVVFYFRAKKRMTNNAR